MQGFRIRGHGQSGPGCRGRLPPGRAARGLRGRTTSRRRGVGPAPRTGPPERCLHRATDVTPVDAHLLELLAAADASRRAAAARITAVVPYFGYAQADKRHGRREAIMASVVAEVLQAVGVDHVVTVDIHAAQIEGFFRVPVDSLTAVPVLTEALRGVLAVGTVVISPDAGRVRMATEYPPARERRSSSCTSAARPARRPRSLMWSGMSGTALASSSTT